MGKKEEKAQAAADKAEAKRAAAVVKKQLAETKAEEKKKKASEKKEAKVCMCGEGGARVMVMVVMVVVCVGKLVGGGGVGVRVSKVRGYGVVLPVFACCSLFADGNNIASTSRVVGVLWGKWGILEWQCVPRRQPLLG
jgi:hypothetical protein